MIFYLIFTLIFLAGIASYLRPNLWFIPSILLILLFPSGTSADAINLKEGVFYYDSFLLGIVAGVAVAPNYFKNNTVKIHPLLLTSFLIFSCYALFYLASWGDYEFHYKYFIKDFRPIIMLAEFWVIYEFVFKRLIIDRRIVNLTKQVLLIVFLSNIFKIVLMNFGYFGEANEFYLENMYRYLDAVTWVAAIFMLSYVMGEVRGKFTSYNGFLLVTLSLAVLMIGNSRTMFAAIILTSIVLNLNRPLRVLYIGLISIILASLLILYSIFFDADRIVSALSTEGLFEQIYSRFSPFIEAYNFNSLLHLIFGHGLGVPFEIPWFGYRANMDIYNPNIDNAYLTYVFKYGIFSIVMIYVFVQSFTPLKNRLSSSVKVFVLIIFMVSATHYQIYSMGIFFGWMLVHILSSYNMDRKQ